MRSPPGEYSGSRPPLETAIDNAQVLEEVETELHAIGNARYGVAIAADRRSRLQYFGVSLPALRRRVRAGFSFYELEPSPMLRAWDYCWNQSAYGDVLFAAVEYYRLFPRRWPPELWSVIREWSARVDNWAHADTLGGLYSYLLAADEPAVYPVMLEWNRSENEWLRRLSLVSLIHYTGKNAVFLPPEKVLPLVTACLTDRRHYVQTAVGWILREMGNAYPVEILAYLHEHAREMSATALTRAAERLSPEQRRALRQLRPRRVR
jgi:3-methyladenine DNA glycosylase AlkD